MSQNFSPTSGSTVNTAFFVTFRGAVTPQLAYTTSRGAVLAMAKEMEIIREGRSTLCIRFVEDPAFDGLFGCGEEEAGDLCILGQMGLG
ncbi:hypothetical protein PQX77_002525, partial [Marasmius sp. AFHP31]